MKSENFKRFESSIRVPVETLVEHTLKKRGLSGIELYQEQAERMARLVLFMPFYSIESWVYQAHFRLRELCAKHCGRHLGMIDTWSSDPGLLDEVVKPKDTPTCIGSAYNHELAKELNLLPVLDIQKSYFAAILGLASSRKLREALARTWET